MPIKPPTLTAKLASALVAAMTFFGRRPKPPEYLALPVHRQPKRAGAPAWNTRLPRLMGKAQRRAWAARRRARNGGAQ